MKKTFLPVLLFFPFLCRLGGIEGGEAFAKKVKFSVNMTYESVNVTGVHITGDFQAPAGFGNNWDPGSTSMLQEASNPNIYSIVVDIPAFQKYEFKFVNGIFGYEAEFVPMESRVNYNFIDNRWIYVDSLANDTLIVGPIVFANNAPAGKYLLRFYADMSNTVISGNGVHVAGGFNNWNTNSAYMYSFDGTVYEYITYVDTGMNSFQHEYKFLNGNTSSDYETVPASCANGNGNRQTTVSADLMLNTVCFSSCGICVTGITENKFINEIKIYPNPMSSFCYVEFPQKESIVFLSDVSGRTVREFTVNSFFLKIERENLKPGLYFLKMISADGSYEKKLIVE